MKINRVEFLNALKFLKPAIGKNESRRNLMCVHCLSKGDKLQMTAANSFIIKRVTLTGSKTVNFEFMILSRQIDDILLILNSHKGPKKNWDLHNIDITKTYFQSNETKIKIIEPQWEYPNLDRLFNKTGKPAEWIGLSVYGLNLITKDWPNPKRALEIHNTGAENGLIINQVGSTYQAVIMPIRLEINRSLYENMSSR